jgi:hypothetical protein
MKKTGLIISIIVFLAMELQAFKIPDKGVKAQVAFTVAETDSLITLMKAAMSQAVLSLQQGDSINSLRNYEISWQLATTLQDKKNIALSGVYVGEHYLKSGKLKEGIKITEEAYNIALEAGYRDIRYQAALLLADAYNDVKSFAWANAYLKDVMLLKDSLNKIEVTENMQLLQQKLENEKSIIQQKAEARANQLQNEIRTKENQLMLAVVASALLFILVIVLFLNNGRVKKKLLKVQKEHELYILAEKQSEESVDQIEHQLYEGLTVKQDEPAEVDTEADVEDDNVEEEVESTEEIPDEVRFASLTREQRYRQIFIILMPQRIRQIEEALKKNDWQQIQRLILVLKPQVIEMRMHHLGPLIEKIEKMDGTTSYLNWHAAVKQFCKEVNARINEKV